MSSHDGFTEPATPLYVQDDEKVCKLGHVTFAGNPVCPMCIEPTRAEVRRLLED